MAEVTSPNSYPVTYYNMSGQKKSFLKYVKDAEGADKYQKVNGLEGYLQDIELWEDWNQQEKHFFYEWRFTLTDTQTPEESDMRYKFSVKEATYMGERLANILAGINQPGKLLIKVYDSENIKNSPGIYVTVDGQKVEFRFNEYDASIKTYKGIPKGEAKDDHRIEFFRNLLFKDIFTNLLGREWSAEIKETKKCKDQKGTSSPQQKEQTFSDGFARAIEIVMGKCASKTSAEFEKDLNTMFTFVCLKAETDFDKAGLATVIAQLQRALDVILNKENIDGNWEIKSGTDGLEIEKSDLPF